MILCCRYLFINLFNIVRLLSIHLLFGCLIEFIYPSADHLVIWMTINDWQIRNCVKMKGNKSKIFNFEDNFGPWLRYKSEFQRHEHWFAWQDDISDISGIWVQDSDWRGRVGPHWQCGRHHQIYWSKRRGYLISLECL